MEPSLKQSFQEFFHSFFFFFKVWSNESLTTMTTLLSNLFHLFRKIFYVNHPSVQFSTVTVMSDSFRPHKLQHARPPCPSPTPRVHWNPCPSSRWCHPTISSSVVPFSSCSQSFPASGSFPMSQLFASGGQSIGVSASTVENSERVGNTRPPGPASWETCVQIRKQQLELDMEQQTGSK